jgi:hypothetical protein
MLPLSIGFSIALGFIGVAGSIYGFDLLLQGSWPLLVVWGLIAGPLLMFVAQSDRDDHSRRRDPR